MSQFINPRLYRFLNEEFSRRPLEEVPERADIRYRLYELHTRIQRAPRSPLNSLDLHPHWRDEYLTNLIELSPFNGHRVPYVYIRYGKSHDQITSFGELVDPSAIPHVHISLGLTSRSFFSGLVFNQQAWFDYENILIILATCPQTRCVLMEAVTELGRAGYRLWGPGLDRPLSDFGTADELRMALPRQSDLLRPEDKVGISRDWAPEEPEINEETIVQTSINEINRLWPVFNTVALRHPR